MRVTDGASAAVLPGIQTTVSLNLLPITAHADLQLNLVLLQVPDSVA